MGCKIHDPPKRYRLRLRLGPGTWHLALDIGLVAFLYARLTWEAVLHVTSIIIRGDCNTPPLACLDGWQCKV
jgi:hypothetical protein